LIEAVQIRFGKFGENCLDHGTYSIIPDKEEDVFRPNSASTSTTNMANMDLFYRLNVKHQRRVPLDAHVSYEYSYQEAKPVRHRFAIVS
jgi:hypothetical protein